MKAVIKKVEEDGESADGMHQHLLVNQIVVIEIRGAETSLVSYEAFVAIRYGDAEGIPARIADFAEGQPIELQGEYIDVNHAHKGVGNPGDSVIHFTHHPIGLFYIKVFDTNKLILYRYLKRDGPTLVIFLLQIELSSSIQLQLIFFDFTAIAYNVLAFPTPHHLNAACCRPRCG